MRYLFLAATIFLLSCVQAQDRIRVHGVTIGGKVLSINNDYILFRTKSGDTIKLGSGDFRLVLKQVKGDKTLYRPAVSEKVVDGTPDNKRFYGQLEMGMIVRNSPQTVVKPSISGSLLYRPMFNLYTGLGTGLNLFDDVRLVPLVAKVSGHISGQSISPYLEIDAGYSFAKMMEKPDFPTEFKPTAEGGLRFHPKLGFKIIDKFSTIFTFGVLYQKMAKETGFIDWRGNPIINREEISLSMMTFGLGFVF